MVVYTQTVVKEKVYAKPDLQPKPSSYASAGSFEMRKVPHVLLRSASFDRLRQFPTYLCSKGSSDIFTWIVQSRTKLSKAVSLYHQQLRASALTISTYFALAFLVLQLMLVAFSLALTSLPNGFIFLAACVPVMSSLAFSLARAKKVDRPSRRTVRTLPKKRD